MSYEEVLQYLYSQLPMFHRIGPAAYKPSLDNTVALLNAVGNPEKNLKCIHVAGTNGKGSTSHLIASSLQEAGYKTGLYTSPHLKDFRERIRINRNLITKEAVIEFVEKYKSSSEKIEPSFFELTVALAFWYFQKQNVSIAVIETGLGGRLDSTNVITPEVSVITTIGYDHMNLLGDSLERIAFEKGGIIKPGIPLVIGNIEGPARKVLHDLALNKKSNIHSVRLQKSVPETTLKGNYQEENKRTAYLALDVLRKERNWKIPEECIVRGFHNVIDNTGLMGRWQILGSDPLIIADVAHNEDGIKSVLTQLQESPHDRLHFILGMVSDKDIDRVLKLLPKDAQYYFCKANIPRGMDADLLKAKALSHGLSGQSFASVPEAYSAARAEATKDDLIFIGGSVFTVAEVL